MLRKIPFKLACNAMIFFPSIVIIFHALVLSGIIPYEIVWGGRLKTVREMLVFESVSIIVILFSISIFAMKAGYIRKILAVKAINFIIWIFVVMFVLNTVGNIFAKTITETLIFTPLTFISATLCSRIAVE